MAIVSMQKMLLVGNNSERKVLLKKIQKLGCVQISKAQQLSSTNFCSRETETEIIANKLGRINFLFEYLNDTKIEAKQFAKKKEIEYAPFKCDSFLSAKPSLSFDEFCNAIQYERQIFEEIEIIQDLCEKQLEIKAQITKEKNLIDSVNVFLSLPNPFSFYKTTKNSAVLVGSMPFSKIESLIGLQELGADYETFGQNVNVAVVAVALKENQSAVQSFLAQSEFVLSSLTFDKTAFQITQECKQNIANLLQEYKNNVVKIVEKESLTPKARLLYDYFTLEQKKIECEEITASTESSYYLEAWFPTDKLKMVDDDLTNSELTLAFLVRPPVEGEIPPTLVVSNKIVAPYESVTNMFSTPKYTEIDPNPFVAFFFFVFFGMMLSDAGYGIILTLLAGVVMAIRRDPKGQGNLIKIMFMGGISTIIWGIVFGSYFGMSASMLHLPYWFNPIEQPMYMLYLSLGMGIFQMCFGLGINMIAMFKAKKPASAICGAFSWYFIIIGIAIAMLTSKLAKWAGILGWSLAGLGVVFLMIAGSLGKIGAKKVSGAFGGLYGIINFFSDLMSYTRIFGLGLATSVIGMVFNQIGMVVKDLVPIKFIGWFAAIIIFVIGHVFNIGINALGTYVHNSRLQFVEFFNKFYSGGGELMQPLGSEMKYYYIKPEEVKKI